MEDDGCCLLLEATIASGGSIMSQHGKLPEKKGTPWKVLSDVEEVGSALYDIALSSGVFCLPKTQKSS